MWTAEKISKSRKSKEKPTGDESLETIRGCRAESPNYATHFHTNVLSLRHLFITKTKQYVRRDPHCHLSPPSRRLPPGFTGDEAGLGVSTGGEYWRKERNVVILRRRKNNNIEFYLSRKVNKNTCICKYEINQ